MIQCDSLVKIYEMEQHKVMALEGLDLTIEDGEMMAIIGKSGSGKSTLLNIIGGLESPTAGILMVDGKDLSSYTEKELVLYRRDKVGFVWQKSARNLFSYLTALENIEAPARSSGTTPPSASSSPPTAPSARYPAKITSRQKSGSSTSWKRWASPSSSCSTAPTPTPPRQERWRHFPISRRFFWQMNLPAQ